MSKKTTVEKFNLGWNKIITEEILIRKISQNPHMKGGEFKTKLAKCACCKNDFQDDEDVWFAMTSRGPEYLCDKCRNEFITLKDRK